MELIAASQPDDVWFHIRDRPSCHVVATMPSDKKIDKKQLRKIAVQGAVVCKQFSKYKSDHNVAVMYAPIAHVAMTETVGSVVVDKYQTIVL